MRDAAASYNKFADFAAVLFYFCCEEECGGSDLLSYWLAFDIYIHVRRYESYIVM